MENVPGVFYYGFDGQPVPREVWSELYMDPRRQIGDNRVGDIRISTVWLGLNVAPWIDGPPHIFETMCFGGPVDQEPFRCTTWEQAQAQHEAMVTLCLLYSDYPAAVVDIDTWEFIASFPLGISHEHYLKTFLHSAAQAETSSPPSPSQSQPKPRTESTVSKDK